MAANKAGIRLTLDDGTDLADKSLEDIVAAAQAKGDKGLFNNSAQTWNHGFYWHSLTPESTAPTGDLAAAIEASIKQEVKDAFAWADKQPFCKPEDGLKNVFVAGSVEPRQFG